MCLYATALVSCFGALICIQADAATAEQFMITVLQSTDPVEVSELLEQQRLSTGAAAGLHRKFRTAGSGRQRRWQVVVSEGQTAFVATGGIVPQLRVPWIDFTRHGPAPVVGLAGREFLSGIYVQARRVQDEMEVRLQQFTDHPASTGLPDGPGAGLRTVVQGKQGRWLDAGGNLLPGNMHARVRGYGVHHGDPRQSRILIRVDVLD